jgi:hypothetical protein
MSLLEFHMWYIYQKAAFLDRLCYHISESVIAYI